MSQGSIELNRMRFSNLTAISRTAEKESGYYLWDCMCDCGNHMHASSKKLQRGTVKDCGCITKTTARRGNIYEDIAGQRFGMFTAIRKEVSKDGKTNWLSKCDCGNARVVQTALLKSGKTWYCDVIQKKRPRNTTMLNLQGQRFGRLTAVESTERRTSSGSVMMNSPKHRKHVLRLKRFFTLTL